MDYFKEFEGYFLVIRAKYKWCPNKYLFTVDNDSKELQEVDWVKAVSEPGPYGRGEVIRRSSCARMDHDACSGFVINTRWTPDDLSIPDYYGEISNATGVLEIPPIPILTVEPVGGEQFTVNTELFDVNETLSTSFICTYKTMSFHPIWGKHYSNVIRTALIERPDADIPHYYNFFYDKVKGLFQIIHAREGDKLCHVLFRHPSPNQGG